MRLPDKEGQRGALSLLRVGSKDACNNDPLKSLDYNLFDQGLNT